MQRWAWAVARLDEDHDGRIGRHRVDTSHEAAVKVGWRVWEDVEDLGKVDEARR